MIRHRALASLVPALLVLLAAVPGCGRDQPAAVGTTVFDVEDRPVMPALAGPTLAGGWLDLADLRGRVVVLNSWASWCEPCRTEMPDLVALSDAADPDNVAVVGLNVIDDPESARSFARALGVTYPSIVDPDGAILGSIPGIPPKALPSTVIIDRQGRVAVRIVGQADRDGLTELVAQVAARPPTASPR